MLEVILYSPLWHSLLWFWSYIEGIPPWLTQPEVYRVLLAWAIAFTLFYIIFTSLGFGPTGVLPGSIAAFFQSFMYRGFTPAGGLFATMTSLAMLGMMTPAVAAISATLATVIALIVWQFEVRA
ncbi:hypothetical protein BKA67DRAFT_662846 [Truncatella angustata]|uniref:Uncharacterized protein n=1 Tax=Truncatella angustata TaxID=152316 RepID=A0A9P8UDW2_9PEZI|nr:uncharacterized protein BKA67DRAFT_662846 [Truncatella angustata]KAH6648116.1 hypothetical protein BKA67DRAFT_662846 [Truncatella angustata]